MKILFVAMTTSVHTQRWISQIIDQGWDIHIFPSMEHMPVHAEFRGVTVHYPVYSPQVDAHPSVKFRGFRVGIPFVRRFGHSFFYALTYFLIKLLQRIYPSYRERALERVIRRLKPDIVHAIEFQHAGYLTLNVKKRMGQAFPVWIVTNWGSDVYLFGRLAAHRDKVRDILALCDYYDAECERDVRIAREMGLRGTPLPVLPNSNGFDFDQLSALRSGVAASERRLIILKGYQHFAGRALCGLQAVKRCADLLGDYRVVVYSATEDVAIAAEILAQDMQIPIDIIPRASHNDILRLFGQARVYIGLSISDAISTSLLEAMVMGAFPIQSNTSCADEWIIHGETGMIVEPEDVADIAGALRRALSDDRLVDEAARRNEQVARERLEAGYLKQQVVDLYRQIIAGRK